MMTDLKDNTIPFWAVPIVVIILPLLVILVVYFIKRDVYGVNQAILGLQYSVIITFVLIDGIKDAVGRPCLDLLWRFPDGKGCFFLSTDEYVMDHKLRELFSQCIEITCAKLMLDEKGVSKDFGFVCFSTPEEDTPDLAPFLQNAGREPINEVKYHLRGVNEGFVVSSAGTGKVGSFAEGSVDLSTMLTVAPPTQQKQILGEHLYPLVRQQKPNLAGCYGAKSSEVLKHSKNEVSSQDSLVQIISQLKLQLVWQQ
ncbi:uncharacterized protein LOC132642743 isoform X2 [Lycium barbarum]|uniref:uncharacterized protein LOC132642743 isoform X2 n=1 Tax=Lycium barbarum TaxID=112863 RepID=UPI00293E1C5E|nr:uncharacterized protein LOC132642743 isoform X2 [Lycium barbarum]